MNTEKMIFIVGNSRSGTTMLGRSLGRHSEIHTFPELQVFERLISPADMSSDTVNTKSDLEKIGAAMMGAIHDGIFENSDESAYVSKVKTLIERENTQSAMSLYKAILENETSLAHKSIPCEQTPRYIFVADEILRSFQNAYVIHIHRDPRDVMLSQKTRWRRRFLSNKRIPLQRTMVAWSNYHPELTARLWRSVMNKAASFASHDRFIEVSYELLLQNPEATLKGVCERVGIQFEPEILAVSREGSSSKFDEKDATGFDASRIGNWQNGGLSATEIAVCEKRVGTVMERSNYPLSHTKSNLIGRLSLYALLPVKLLAIVVLNISRFSNLWQTISRRLL